jgi:hypothetical protein
MNLDHLKRDVGYRVKLVPPAYHLDETGEALPTQDEDWIIMAVTDSYTEISTASGHFYRLGKDHIRSFTTDPNRATDGLNHGFLQLHVQLYICGADVSAVPNHQPGAAVPPPVNLALKARAVFIPELERVFRRQVQILDRVVVNYGVTARELHNPPVAIRPNDTWDSLKPAHPRLFPNAPVFRDLSAADAELLAEFYGAVAEVADLVEHWSRTVALTEYNAWNVLMHKVEHSLKCGELVVQKFCADRVFDATMPVVGSLLSRSNKSLSDAERARAVFLANAEAAQAARNAPGRPMPRR